MVTESAWPTAQKGDEVIRTAPAGVYLSVQGS